MVHMHVLLVVDGVPVRLFSFSALVVGRHPFKHDRQQKTPFLSWMGPNQKPTGRCVIALLQQPIGF